MVSLVYVDEKTKNISGIGPDVMEELAKALGDVMIEWVADSWATLQQASRQTNLILLTL